MARAAKDKALSPSEFLDKLQEAVISCIDGAEDTKDKLAAAKVGIDLAKVRGVIDDEDDGEGMGFKQR